MDSTTNGTLFTPENSKVLAGLGFKTVTVMSDGARPETYEDHPGRGRLPARARPDRWVTCSELPSGERLGRTWRSTTR